MDDHDVIQVPALGRPFRLGILYDARRDVLISGLNLWNSPKLATDISMVSKPGSRFKIFTSSTMFDKLDNLKLSGDLKFSILGGLIDVGGSAAFLKESNSSAESVRVTLQYSRTSQTEHMTRQLTNDQIDYPDYDFQMATHVVSAITYGGAINLEFEKKVASDKQEKEAESFLKTQLEIFQVALGAHAGPKWSTEERTNLGGLKCQFYGDIQVEEVPTTYFECIEFFKHQLLRMKEDKGVPVEVTLHSLRALTPNHGRFVRQISDGYYKDVEYLVQQYASLEDKCVELIRFSGNVLDTPNADDPVCFKDILERLARFKDSLTEHISSMLKMFLGLIPQVRGGTKTVYDLENVIETMSESYWEPKRLDIWLEEKRKELNSLKMYMAIMNQIRFVSPDNFDAALKDSEKDFSFVFVFTSLGREESFLLKLKKSLISARRVQMESARIWEEPAWCDVSDTSNRVERLVRFYADFVENNKANEHVSFFVSLKEGAEYEGAAVELYRKGELVGRSLYPLSMDSPEVYRDEEGIFFARWKPCTMFSNYVKGYNIYSHFNRFIGGKKGFLRGSVSAADIPIVQLRSHRVCQIRPVFQFGEGPATTFNEPSEGVSLAVVKNPPFERCQILDDGDLPDSSALQNRLLDN